MIGADRRDERLFDQRSLLGNVRVEVAGRRCGGARASRIRQAVLAAHTGLQMVTDLEPSALVHRLLLAPEHFLRRRIFFELRGDLFAWERVKLFHADDGDVLEFPPFGLFQQVV